MIPRAKFLLSILCLSAALFAKAQSSDLQFDDVLLRGRLTAVGLEIEASGRVHLKHKKGAQIHLLNGELVLREPPHIKKGELLYQNDNYILSWNRRGDFDFSASFLSSIQTREDTRTVGFQFLNAPLRRIELEGFPPDCELQIEGAPPPRLEEGVWVTNLPPSGWVGLSWKPRQERDEGKLFFAVEEMSVAAVAAGLVKQNHQLDLQIMQGGLRALRLKLDGVGEVSEVKATDLLGWEVQDEADGSRTLNVAFTRPQTARVALLIRTQTALSAFPIEVDLLRLRPLEAVRTNGHLLVLNNGAVNLSIAAVSEISQIAPTQLPLHDGERGALQLDQHQSFAFRFAGTKGTLQMRAEDIVPEVSATTVTMHHLGLNAASLDYTLQLAIREAPLRELEIRLPSLYSLVEIEGRVVTDSFLTESSEGRFLRLLFAEPLIGAQIIHLSLENNAPPRNGTWTLPVVTPVGVDSIRGHIGITTDDGLKVSRREQSGLSEIMPGFFPVKRQNLQLAWRQQSPQWTASVHLERLEPSIQVEGFHLYSTTENLAYGSAILTYQITGAPIQTVSLTVPEAATHVEFYGAELRDWKPEDSHTFRLVLHRPIAGTWSLLVTFEMAVPPAPAQLECAGVCPLGVKSENGYIAIVSPHQTELDHIEHSPSLLTLEPSELPPEYQLLIDAPLLAAYHYTARPVALKLSPRTLPRRTSLDQVIEFAKIETQLSEAGEVMNTADLVLKSKNQAHFDFELPAGARLWEVLVDGKPSTPAFDAPRILIPLRGEDVAHPQHISIKYAISGQPDTPLELETPAFGLPVVNTKWTVRAGNENVVKTLESTVEPTPAPPVSSFPPQRLWRTLTDDGWGTVPAFVLVLLTLAGCLSALLVHTPQNRLGIFTRQPLVRILGTGTALLGLFACLLASRFVWAEPEVMPATAVTFHETILPSNAQLSCTIEHVENSAASSTNDSMMLLVPVALVLPLLLRIFVQKIASGRLRPLVSGLTTVILMGAILSLPHGPALVFVGLAGQLFLVPISQAVAALKYLRWKRRGTPMAASTAMIALCGMGGLAPTSEAQMIDYTQLDAFVQKSPIHLEVLMCEDVVEVETVFTWDAEKGERLPLLRAPAVLMKLNIPDKSVTLLQDLYDDEIIYLLQANRSGTHAIELQYQCVPTIRDNQWSCSLPSTPSLYYTADVLANRENSEINSLDSVGRTVLPTEDSTQSRYRLYLTPSWDVSLSCAPKTRDPDQEETVFYAESIHHFVPLAGSVEGNHELRLRLAQGRLRQFAIELPHQTTVVSATAPWIESWRFDPARNQLTVTAREGLTTHHTLTYTTQTSAAALPYERSLQLPICIGARAETGWVGLSTPPDVQLDTVDTESSLANIALGDFPVAATVSDHHLRRAWRFSDPNTSLTASVSSVAPEIRVTTEQRTSLGEDRLVHAAKLNLRILRSGIFEVHLNIPDHYEIESLTGTQLSHWTEFRSDKGRIATLHFKTRTLGETAVFLNLTGPGIRATRDWSPPKISVIGAAKENGQLIITPETGLRVRLQQRNAVSPINPADLESSTRNVLAYRLLSADWQLRFDLESVSPWLEGQLLQDITVHPGLIETSATIRYTIKNAGLKTFRLRLPSNAFSVRMEAESLASYAQEDDASGDWMLRLERRVIGNVELKLSYHQVFTSEDPHLAAQSIQLLDTSSQETYLAVRARQRLLIKESVQSETLTATEWKQIPDKLRHHATEPAQLVFRTVEPEVVLNLEYDLLQMAKILPAQVRRVALHTIIAASGETLNSARFEIVPGHKRQLAISLPPDSEFWSSRVNQASVWPAEDSGCLLIPLTPPPTGKDATVVEIQYSSRTDQLDSAHPKLLGPQCDLPLEAITWTVHLPSTSAPFDWEGNLQLESRNLRAQRSVDLEDLMDADRAQQSRQLENAESLLRLGETLAARGDPNAARRALASAYSISRSDVSFNEDARVQLDNLKIQQAMVGLTNRRNSLTPTDRTEALVLDAAHFSSDEADTLLNTTNSADQNTALAQLARRFLAHQSAHHGSPTELQSSIPREGPTYIFSRRLLVDAWQTLELTGAPSTPGSEAAKGHLWALGLLALLVGLASTPRSNAPSRENRRKQNSQQFPLTNRKP